MMSARLLVHFECQSNKQTTIKEVELPPVTSVMEIKEYFEEKFNVPVCMQTLRHSSVVLRDDTSVTSLRLRDGDALHVSYHATAECEELSRVIHWLEALVSSFKEGDLPETSVLRNDQLLEQLSFDFFSPWGAPEKYANKQYFIAKGGLSVMMQLYSYLLKNQWNDLPESFKILESDLLTSLGYLAIDIPFRHAILKEGGLKMCLMSLLRVPVHVDEPLAFVQCEIIGAALWVLTWLCDFYDCRMEVATNMAAMRQLSQILRCPSSSVWSVENVINLCVTLAYSSEIHGNLAEAGLIESLIFSDLIPKGGEKEQVLFSYHIAVFLAQTTLASPQLIEKNEHLDKIHTFLGGFLHKADLRKITHYEMSYVWATLLPYIKLAYIPNVPCCEPVLLSETQDMALQTIVLAMQSMLANKIHREVLVKEGLVDFLTCMPWYTTGPIKERAKSLVRMVQQAPDMDLQPPSLLNMTKVCVAKHFCGLPTVVQLSVPNILHHATSD